MEYQPARLDERSLRAGRGSVVRGRRWRSCCSARTSWADMLLRWVCGPRWSKAMEKRIQGLLVCCKAVYCECTCRVCRKQLALSRPMQKSWHLVHGPPHLSLSPHAHPPSSSSFILLSCVLPLPDIPSVNLLTITGSSPFFAPKCILQRASSTLMSFVQMLRTSARRCSRSRSSLAARRLHTAQALSRRREWRGCADMFCGEEN